MVGTALLAGCAGSDTSTIAAAPADDAAWDSLFAPPASSTTSDTIFGVWAASDQIGIAKADARFKFEANRLTLASRCRFDDGTVLTVGASVAARVTEDKTVILESKEVENRRGTIFCRVNASPRTLEYAVRDGRALVHTDNPAGAFTMTKLAD